MLAKPIELDGNRLRLRFFSLFVDVEADRAAIEDGVLAVGGSLPNPVYLRDLKREATYRIPKDIDAAILREDETGVLGPSPTSRNHLMDVLRSCTRTDSCGMFWVIASEGLVRTIAQEYIP